MRGVARWPGGDKIALALLLFFKAEPITFVDFWTKLGRAKQKSDVSMNIPKDNRSHALGEL